jgi:hypothetical protein
LKTELINNLSLEKKLKRKRPTRNQKKNKCNRMRRPRKRQLKSSLQPKKGRSQVS